MMTWKRERKKREMAIVEFTVSHTFFDTRQMKRCGLCPLLLNVGRLSNCFDQGNREKTTLPVSKPSSYKASSFCCLSWTICFWNPVALPWKVMERPVGKCVKTPIQQSNLSTTGLSHLGSKCQAPVEPMQPEATSKHCPNCNSWTKLMSVFILSH